MWKVEYTDTFRKWFDGLTDEKDVASIRAAMRVLRDEGPTLPRPLVDTIKSSDFANMKELRPVGTTIRILFAFDPRRTAILLLGGDKVGRWKAWYAEQIPKADRLFAEHLRTVAAEETEQQTAARTLRDTKRRRKR